MPNTQIAVGRSKVLEMTNDSIDVWRRSSLGGTPEFHQEICSWFGVSQCSDPRAFYDAGTHRYFAVIESPNYIVVGVSAGSDPTRRWSFEHLDVPWSAEDNPRLAITTDKVIIGDNGNDFWIFEKKDYLAATSGRVHARMVHRTSGTAVTGPINFVFGNPSGPTGYAEARGGTDTRAALVTAITGTPAHHDVALKRTVLHVKYRWRDPVRAPQKGGPVLLADNGFYPYQGVLAVGSIWYPSVEPCIPHGDNARRDCIHLVQIDISGRRPRFVKEIEIGARGKYLVTPAVAVDNHGRAAVVATETSPHMFASVVAIPVGADGTIGTATMLRRGMSYNYAGYYAPDLTRWGDESATAVDPLNPARLWLAGEYSVDRLDWGTSISSVTIHEKRLARDARTLRAS